MTDNFQLLKSRIDLASYVERYVSLKRAGSLLQGLCPLPGHAEKTASFQVKGDHWTCRGKCGVGGDIFDFVQAMTPGLTRVEALTQLAEEYCITLETSAAAKATQDQRTRLYVLMDEAANFYHAALYAPEHAAHLAYLRDARGLSLATLNEARIGFAAGRLTLYKHLTSLGYSFQDMLDVSLIGQGDNAPYDFFYQRLTIPVYDSKGRAVGFSARSIEATPTKKYLLPKETERGLFRKSHLVHRMPTNRTTSRSEAFETCVIVEGTLDPVSAFNRGILNVVSIMGKSLSDDQLTLLARSASRLVFCLDKDEAGRKGLRALVEKHAAKAASLGIELYAMVSPHGKDPDDCFREKPELWQPAVDAARPCVDVLIDLEMQALGDYANATQKTTLVRNLVPVLKNENPLVQRENIDKLALAVGIPADDMARWLTPQMSVVKGHVKALAESYPINELEVLHGILVNSDQWWLERANAALDTMGHYPFALQPLSQNDFQHPETRDLMATITRVHAQAAPDFDIALRDAVGMGPLYNVYWRATCKPEVIPAFATAADLSLHQDYAAFLKSVYLLRQIHLELNIRQGIDDQAHEMEAIVVKNMLSRKQAECNRLPNPKHKP